MKMMTIESLEHSWLVPFRDLRKLKERRYDHYFVGEGVEIIRRALNRRLKIDKLLTTSSHFEEMVPLLNDDIEVAIMASADIANVSGFNFHRGCLAIIQKPQQTYEFNFQQLLYLNKSVTIFAENIGNPLNVGALIRHACAFSADLVVLNHGCADPYLPKAIRTSMGALFSQTLVVEQDLSLIIPLYKQMIGGDVIAMTLNSQAEPLSQIKNLPRHVAFVVGSEGVGITQPILSLCDRQAIIPMAQCVDSLNVAAATAVLMFAIQQKI